MACFYPTTGARDLKGVLRFGKNAVGLDLVVVSCGQCAGCKAERKRQWAVRGMHELQMTLDQDPIRPTPIASFITLTYADQHLPINGNLELRDWQLFAKRLRYHIGPFRFLMCGEYGEEELHGGTERAHLHAIIFGHDFHEDRTLLKTTREGHDLFISPALDATWKNGLHTIGSVTTDSIAYVAGYINKRIRGDKAEEHYRRVNKETGEEYDQVPEFGNMSRGEPGGLGITWIQKYYPEVYPRDEVVLNGVSGTPPAFYDRWYAKHFPIEMEAIKEARIIKAKKHKANNTPERLAVREAVFKGKYTEYKRRKNQRQWRK